MKKQIAKWLSVCCAALAACGAGAADLVSVSSAAGTTNYETIQTALAACSGGETVTLLGDVAVSGALSIDTRVTIDLGGHTLANSAAKAQFIKPGAGCDGLVIRNGAVDTLDCCFAFQQADAKYTVSVSNVTFTGLCLLYGQTGTLEFQEDCVCRCTYLCSSWSNSGCALNVRGGVVAPSSSFYDNMETQGTILGIFGGSFTLEPGGWVSDGYITRPVEHEAHGIACSYRVEERNPGEYSAEVESADGGTVTQYPGLGGALTACTNGCTLRLLRDCSLSGTFAVSANFTLDLDGFTLASSVRTFTLSAGATNFWIVNGTCTSGTAAFMASTYSNACVTVSNSTIRADAAIFGANHVEAGRARFVDCDLRLNYLTSLNTKMEIDLENCRASYAVRVNDGRGDAIATIRARSGRFTHNMTPWLASGFVQLVDETTVDGVAYRFRVLPADEAGTLDAAEVISADGATTNRYAALPGAVNGCPADGTVRLLQNVSIAGELAVPRNMTLDLCGLLLANTSGNFIKPAKGVTLNVRNGDLRGQVSLFNVDAGADVTVNVTNCSIMGLCPVYGKGTVNTSSCWFRNLNQLKSGNGTATMNVYDGLFASFNRWSDSSAPSAGTTVRVFSGSFMVNPMTGMLKDHLLAPDSGIYMEPRSYSNENYPYRVVDAAGVAERPAEAVWSGLDYTNVVTALKSAAEANTGSTVTLRRTITRSVATPNLAGAYVFDFGGHEFAVSGDVLFAYGGPFTLRNGAIRLMMTSRSAIVLQEGAQVTAASSFALIQNDDASSFYGCGVYAPGHNARLVFDGSTIATRRFISWGPGTNLTIEVTGDGTNTCQDMYWPGTSPRTGSRLIVRGGWWKADPTAWVTNNHVILHQAAATPCGWRVRDFSKLAAGGWEFAFGDPFIGATATGTLVAEGPVTVRLTGTVPTRRTLLADLSSVTVTGGTLAFAKDPSLGSAVQVKYDAGRLYAWEAKGTLVVVR